MIMGTIPPSGVIAVVHRVDRAVGGRGGRHRPQARVGNAEPDLLAFHVGGIEPERGELRIARALRPVDKRDAGEEHDRHGGVERPALPLVLDHATESVRQRRRDQQNVEHLDEIAQRRRVLVRDGGVGVPEAAAIGAELLDRDLRCGRTLADHLLGALQGGRIDVWPEVLRHPLPDQDQRARGTRAAAARRGSQRVRSTQKLPTVLPDVRAKARISAMASAMPVAAETKFCVVSAAICVR